LKVQLRWAVVPAVFLFDRLTKTWITSHYAQGEGFAVVSNVFHITRVNNTGAAFGLWRGATFFLIAVTAAAALAIFVTLWRSHRASAAAMGWSLVLAGALGNLYDRLRFGYVIDMIDLRVWPVFNVADSAICVGAAFVLWSVFRASRPR
jgi:signal peptidase II